MLIFIIVMQNKKRGIGEQIIATKKSYTMNIFLSYFIIQNDVAQPVLMTKIKTKIENKEK